MQQMPDHLEKTDPRVELSCLKGTVYKGRREVDKKYGADTKILYIVTYHYRSNRQSKNIVKKLKRQKMKIFSYPNISLDLLRRIFLLMQCTGWSNVLYGKRTVSRKFVILFVSNFRNRSGKKLSSNDRSVCINFIPGRNYYWNNRNFLHVR